MLSLNRGSVSAVDAADGFLRPNLVDVWVLLIFKEVYVLLFFHLQLLT